MEKKERAGNNRTLTLKPEEIAPLKAKLVTASNIENTKDFANKTVNGDIFEMIKYIPDEFADLIIIDPPYNLTKNFNGMKFNSRSENSYDEYLATWFPEVCKKLKADGTLYMCGDWKCTSSLQRAIEKELTIINRITWQREKGRGAKSNWKNGMEDIWFAVKNPNNYYFDVEAVMMKRRVLASSREGDIVFDPFLGSGTASVVAKKLNRKYCGIELNEEYSMWAEKRLEMADTDKTIQGYSDGVFWERNTLSLQQKLSKKSNFEDTKYTVKKKYLQRKIKYLYFLEMNMNKIVNEFVNYVISSACP